MSTARAGSIRKFSYWGLTVALVLLAALGIAQALTLQKDWETNARKRLERDLVKSASYLDALVADQARSWLLELGRAEDLRARELLRREQVSWFDTWYVWEPGPRGPEFLYPEPALIEDDQLIMAASCLTPYKLAHSSNRYIVASLLRFCQDHARPMVRLFASTEAARRLLDLGRPWEAWAALEEINLSPTMPLDQAAGRDMPPRRNIHRRLQLAEALAGMGRRDLAVQLLVQVADDAASQGGPILEQILPAMEWDLVPQLRALGADREATEAELGLRRVERRLAGWQEIRDALATRGEPPAWGEEPRLIYDIYGDPPFLLITSQLDVGRLVGAVQIEQSALLDELLAQAGDDRTHLVVLDTEGKVLAGQPGDPVIMEVPFRTLKHLRLGYRSSVLEDEAPRMGGHALPLLPPLLGAILGGVALAASFAADRRERELRDRQREFTARVTHELKTPLTGIRLMAENLEMGLADDPQVTRDFSRRILEEVDRLTARVDQILQVARERVPAAPEWTRLDEILETLLVEWGPRMNDAGVMLEEDIPPLSALVDPVLIRDALACLLDNALKYHRPDRDDPCVWVSLRREGPWAVFEVADNGMGVPPDKRAVIFERYARVEGPGRGKTGGHGLGLSFVAAAVSEHLGRVECVAGVDGGARFNVRIPITHWKTRLSGWLQRLSAGRTRWSGKTESSS